MCCRSGLAASTSSLDWSEGERSSMRFLNHLLCRPLRDLWTEDPPELRARGGASRWRPTIRSASAPQSPCRTCTYIFLNHCQLHHVQKTCHRGGQLCEVSSSRIFQSQAGRPANIDLTGALPQLEHCCPCGYKVCHVFVCIPTHMAACAFACSLKNQASTMTMYSPVWHPC